MSMPSKYDLGRILGYLARIYTRGDCARDANKTSSTVAGNMLSALKTFGLLTYDSNRASFVIRILAEDVPHEYLELLQTVRTEV